MDQVEAEEAARGIQRFSHSVNAFWSMNTMDSLVSRYGDGSWLAVHDGRVVAYADDMVGLVGSVHLIGLDRRTAYFVHATTERKILIL